MPIYEYQCESCSKLHEVMQKFSDPLLESCPDCGGSVTKLMSMTSFALKGSGWYTTDYKRPPAGASTSKPAAPASEPAPAAKPSAEPAVNSGN